MAVRRLLPCLLVVAVAVPVLALAEDNQGQAPAPPPASGYVERVQVVTSHVPEGTQMTPASVTVLTREDMLRRGAYDLRSALLLAAGIDISPGGDGGPAASVPEIWGLREFDAFLLTVDGVPWGGAYNPALDTLDLNNVDRIEVLRGAAPVTYGATAFAGVINVVHAAPGSTGQSLHLSGGSFGSGSVAWSSPMPEWAGMQSSLTLDASRQGFSSDRTDVGRGHLRWQNSRKTGSGGTFRFGLDGIWQQQDPGSPHPLFNDEITTLVPVDSNQNPRGSHLDQTRDTIDGGYDRPFGSGTWSTTLSATRSRLDILRGFLTDVSASAPNANGFRQTIPTLDVYLDSHFVLKPSAKVEVVAGFDHLHGAGHGAGGDFDYFVNLNGSAAPDGGDIPSAARVFIRDQRDFSGLYGQVTWEPADRLHIEIGGRLNHTVESRTTDTLEFGGPPRVQTDDKRTVTRGSGFAGLTWTAWRHAADGVHLYANYRNTYKPAAIDFGLDSDPEILAPETATSYEGGVKNVLASGRVDLEASLFQMDFANLVLSQDVGGTPTLINGGTQRFRGVEVAGGLRPTQNFEWRLSYSLHDARFRDFVSDEGGVPGQFGGNRLEMSPRYLAATEVVVGGRKGWHGNVRANWVGSRFLDRGNEVLAPDYVTWGAGVGYVLGDVEIRLDGYNINNQRPPVSESELGPEQYYLMPARRVMVSARWLFGGSQP